MYTKKNNPFQYNVGTHMGIQSLFPLTETELRAVIKKKKGAPKGKLRDFYTCNNNRDLIAKIAREFFFYVIWDVIHGHTFYLSATRKSKIYIAPLPEWYLANKRKRGLYKFVDLKIWDYKLPVIRVKSSKSKRKEDYMISLNGEFLAQMYRFWETGNKIGGKKPKFLKDYLPEMYEKFPYLREESINYILNTFITNYKIAVDGGAKVTVRDSVNWMLSHPLTIYETKGNYDYWRKFSMIKKIKAEKVKKLVKEQKEIFKDVAIS